MKAISKTFTFIGFQSSGKTTLGRLLAHQLQCSFKDTDQLIEEFHPTLSCSEIFKTFGETYFRQLEAHVITSLNYHLPFILATGGGSLLQESNRFILKKNCTLIYLKTSSDILKERIAQRATLPGYLSSSHFDKTFDRIYQERSAIYEKWADHIIYMDGLNIEQALKVVFKHRND